MTGQDFAGRLKSARAAAGLSQQAMTDKTLIPVRTLEDWEAGRRTPPEYVQRFVLRELGEVVLSNDRQRVKRND